MCGIFGYMSSDKITQGVLQAINVEGMKCKSRGPDNTVTRKIGDNIFLMFHRLKINDTSELGNQPIVHPDDYNITVICNGEIYNWRKLATSNNFKTKSTSDCEIIVHMYKKYGIEETVKSLDGVFAFILIDSTINKIYAARDPIGVRSLYVGCSPGVISFGSECKTLDNICNEIIQFKPGSYITLDTSNIPSSPRDIDFTNYYSREYDPIDDKISNILPCIRNKLNLSIDKRLLSDRPIGCLLSGGLDSSLIAALVSNKLKTPLHTFSIGLEGAVDLKYAKIVSEHLGTVHSEYIITEEEMFNSIEDVVKTIETYDITTIRASIPMFLLCKHIKNTTDITVLFSGEGSDEASGSYLYFHNTPNEAELQTEILRLMKDLSYFDVLRSDKSTASAGLEVRVPFLDKEFLEYYLGLLPKFKMPKTYSMEKYLLRKAFDIGDILPKEVLWRTKEGMSDGVSSQNKSWAEIIQDKVDTVITDEEFNEHKLRYTHNPPQFKEAYYYRKLFEKTLKNRSELLPYYWLPRWSGDITDPSARILNVYDKAANQ